MARTDQTHDELLALLAEQRGFLQVSCAAFDAGEHAEAKRIATILRDLLDQFGAGLALLARLGTRDRLGWLDTAGSILPLVAGAQTPLVFAQVGDRPAQSRAVWLPTLDAWDRRLQERPRLPPDVEESLAQLREERVLRRRGAWLSFTEWWGADILRDMAGQDFSRAELVNAWANISGEPHSDPEVDDLRRRLTRPDSFGWAIKLEGGPHVPLLSPALSSVRQVAFEVERSLHRGLPPA